VLRDIYISLNLVFFWWNESEERERLGEERERLSEERERLSEERERERVRKENGKREMKGRNAGITILTTIMI